jgi:hypothetical protein
VTQVPVGAITGGAVGGVALLLLSMIGMFLVLRRRFRRARVTFTIEDSEEDPPAPQAEEDMPPPEYQRVFPTVRRAMSLRVLAPAWAGGYPRRKRGRVVSHPNDAIQASTHSNNVASLPHVEIAQRATAEVRPSQFLLYIHLKRWLPRWRSVTSMLT